MPLLRAPDGSVVNLPDEQAGQAVAGGYTPIDIREASSITTAPVHEDGGVLGAVGSGVAGVLSGATLGGSDYLLKGMFTKGQFEQMVADRERHNVIGGVGQVAGMILPAIVAPESLATPAGALSRFTTGIAEAGRAAGGAGGAARVLAAGAVEGAVQNAGAYLSETALGDRDLSAEGMSAALGSGFAFGAGGGAVALGVEKGTMAARRMFSRVVDGSARAANEAEQAWRAAYQTTVEANSAAADVARAALAEARAARQQAGLVRDRASLGLAEAKAAAPEVDAAHRAAASLDERVAKIEGQEAVPVATPGAPMVGRSARDRLSALGYTGDEISAMAPDAADDLLAHGIERPAGGVPAPAGPGGPADLQRLVAGFGQRSAGSDAAAIAAASEDEIRLAAALGEHDAALSELEAMLQRIEAPGVEGAGPTPGVPVGEFGAPGARGYNPGGVAAPRPPTAVEAATGDVTVAGKKGLAQGTPPRPLGEVAAEEAGIGAADAAPTPRALASAQTAPLTDDEFDRFALSKQAKLSPRETEALLAYSNNGLFAQINAPLRQASGHLGSAGMKPVAKDLHTIVRKVDSGIANSPAPREMVVYRGVSGTRSTEALGKLRPGDEFVDPGFGSTSYLHQIGKDFSDGFKVRPGVEIQITVPKGFPAMPIPSEFPKEREILLPRGVRYKVLSAETDANGRKIVKMLAGRPDPVVAAKEALPPGFAADAVDSDGRRIFNEGVEVHSGVPQAKDISRASDRDVAFVVRPSDLAEAGVIGRSAAREPWSGASDVPAIEVAIHESRDFVPGPDGRPLLDMHGNYAKQTVGYSVIDGNKRLLAAAADGDRPMAVRFVLKVSKPSSELAPLADDIRKAIGSTSAERAAGETATESLTGLLRGTAKKLDEGSSLGEIASGSPAKKAYVEQKLAKRAEDAAFFRAKHAGGDVAETFTVNRPNGPVELKIKTETKPLAGGKPRTVVTVTRKLADGEEVPFATAEFTHRENTLYPEHVNVEPGWQRQGIGTRMYEAAEQASGKKVIPSDNQTVEGKAFSAKYRGRAAAPSGGGDLEALLRSTKQKLDEGSGMREMAGHPFSAKQLEAAHEAAIERAAAATTPAEAHAAEAEAHAIEQHLTAVGARPGAVEDVAAVAHVATRYEKAGADLAEALGEHAPPAAREAAKAFRAAEDAADRKMMDRATRAIDDHVETGDWLARAEALGGRVRPDRRTSALPTSAQQIAEAKAGKLTADAALARARVAETEASIGAKAAKSAADDARKTAEAARPAGVAAEAHSTGALGTIATAVGVAGELGVPGIPKPHDIPIIGPLLGVYFKYRAIKAAAGRFVGRIPATGNARAAALVAKTKDRIAVAVDRSLGLTAELAPKARGAIVATTTALARRAFDDGEPDAKKGASAQVQAAVRIREISTAATRPDLITQMVRREMHGISDPDLIAAAEKHLAARFQHLAGVVPKMPPPNPYDKREWVPSPGAAADLGQRLAVANDPEAAFKIATPAAAQTLKGVYPQLFELAKQRLLERVGDLKQPVPYESRLRNSLLFGVPLDVSVQPDNAAILRTAHEASGQNAAPTQATPPAPAIANTVNVNTLYQPGLDRHPAMR